MTIFQNIVWSSIVLELPLVWPCCEVLRAYPYYLRASNCFPGMIAFNIWVERLALRVVDVLPPSVGYLGIDLVLGETEAADRIIEINPRLTTSYVGLSQLTKGNLAEAMLGVALGATCTLRFRSEPIWFDATGAGVAVEDHYDSPVTRQGVRA